ncbi:MAG: hypothetical protein AAF384_13355 [Pseudomonadota bacterium]
MQIDAGASLNFDLVGYAAQVTLSAEEAITIDGTVEQPGLSLSLASNTAINIGLDGLVSVETLIISAPTVTISGLMNATSLLLIKSGTTITDDGNLIVGPIGGARPPDTGAPNPSTPGNQNGLFITGAPGFDTLPTPTASTITFNSPSLPTGPTFISNYDPNADVTAGTVDIGALGFNPSGILTGPILTLPVAVSSHHPNFVPPPTITLSHHYNSGNITLQAGGGSGGTDMYTIVPSGSTGGGPLVFTTVPEVPSIPIPAAGMLFAPALILLGKFTSARRRVEVALTSPIATKIS